MSNDWTDCSKVRNTFVDFFVQKCGHDSIPSSLVVPHEDPSLLFINAGMNQFKSIFVGTVDPNSAFGKLKRAANSQKCIRAGGKHNDLEDVGKDSYHHTFFEMLGNWSFGDYFKVEAIDWAWELLTKVYGLDPNRIYVTYFGGDPKLPTCPPDYEARDLWKKYLPESRILPFGGKENFWEMAETGPCGPCSEIHYDRIGNRDVANLVNMDDPNVVEIWNLVFMQYNREKDRSLTPLPFGSVDTGMGMERLASILIDKPSNYDIQLFQKIFKAIQNQIPALADRPYSRKEGSDDVDGVDMAYRVVADHIRTLSIAIADGAMPSNDGRGYVLRRILRRAVRYGKQKLNAPAKPWFCHLVSAVVESLGDAFPTLKKNEKHIQEVIAAEERQFTSTLERGLREFDRVLTAAKAEGKTKFPGGEPGAFTLFTTYGFPLDLTQLMAEEQGMAVDMAEYEAHFEEHRRKAREGGKKNLGDELKLQQEQLFQLAKEMNAVPTCDVAKYEWNSAHGSGSSTEATVLAVFNGKTFESEVVASSEESKTIGLVLDRTNFYSEAGGQVADIGTMSGFAADDDMAATVEDVQRFGAYVLHTVKLTAGAVKPGQKISLLPEFARRAQTAKNHTATHILNFALSKAFGSEVEQKGSLVEPSRLRFDFSFSGVPETEVLAEVEALVNKEVAEAKKVYAVSLPLEDARKIPGLRFLAGEQYPDPVRVVSLCKDDVAALVSPTYQGEGGKMASVEFCGGTHLSNTTEINNFVIMSEEGVAKGVRRIVGYTGEAALTATEEGARVSKIVRDLRTLSAAALETEVGPVRGMLEAHQELPLLVKRGLLKEVDAMKATLLEAAKNRLRTLLENAKVVATNNAEALTSAKSPLVIDASAELEGEAKAVDACAKALETAHAGCPFILVSGSASGVTVISVGGKGFDAKEVLQPILDCCGGRGGGKPARALGSSKTATPEQIAACVAKAKELAAKTSF